MPPGKGYPLKGRRVHRKPGQKRPTTVREDVKEQTAILLNPAKEGGRKARKAGRGRRKRS